MSSQPPLTRSTQKLFPFSLSLSLSRQDRCWYHRGLFLAVYSFEREDPPLIISIHFLFVFSLHFSSRPLEFLLRFFTLGRLQTIISFLRARTSLFKSDVFSLSLFFARSQHHLGDDFDDARPTFCRRRLWTPTHSRSRALGERTAFEFEEALSRPILNSRARD